MKKNLLGIEDNSTSNYLVKTIIAVTTCFFSILLAGCDSAVLEVKSPPPITAANQHLEELAPKPSIHNLQPMFKVEALGFTAVDETGWDWLGADEIYAVWRSNAIVSTLIQEGVDSGDSFDFHQLQSCIYPIAGNELIIDGRSARMGLQGRGRPWADQV